MQAFAPEAVHRRLLNAARPALAWTDARPPGLQRAALADKLAELVKGPDDRLFPLAGVEAAFARARAIYARLDAADRCRFVLCEGGHRFYANEAWAAFGEIMDAGKP